MIAYIDMFSGISGDMMLGALADLGVPLDRLSAELSGLLSGFKLKSRQVSRHHLRATDLIVETDEDKGISRNYRDIKALIQNSGLPENVKKNSLTAFEKIALAESKIHGHDIQSIHFHEIGGIDSIVDIIGSFLGLEYLNIKEVYASEVPLGSGFVECSHGILPVPVPATLAILKDTTVRASDAKTEIVTPTGAAIITTLSRTFGSMPDMKIIKTGYGAGKRQTGSALPNLLRIILGEKREKTKISGIQKEVIYVIKSQIDDMSPEISGWLMESLMETHALDVAFIPVQMKKNRPGVKIEVLCKQENLDSLVKLIFSETTTIGLRVEQCERYYLLRESLEIPTSLGLILAKKITKPNGEKLLIPEYEAAKEVAKKKDLPLHLVYIRLLSEINQELKIKNGKKKS
ncbi:MAG: nickel pincer cofactor biosynthesis protein LarC [Desulfobacula sp.]|nr:nickel pincer cofactor biosynthesis protein LarC [Desulfobacula sp.]